MARAVGGWHLSGILTYRKGAWSASVRRRNLPLFAGPNYASTVTGVAQKASWVGNFDPATDRYLNVAAFTLPATNTLGTGGQYLPNVFGFFYMNENLSLAKNTRHQGAPRPRPSSGDVQHVQSRRIWQWRNGYFKPVPPSGRSQIWLTRQGTHRSPSSLFSEALPEDPSLTVGALIGGRVCRLRRPPDSDADFQRVISESPPRTNTP